MCYGVAGYSLSYAVSMVICEQGKQYLRVNMLVKGMQLNVCPAISASVETILGNFAHRLSLVPLCTNPKLNILHNWELWQDHV
jgi:hypothetical protein